MVGMWIMRAMKCLGDDCSLLSMACVARKLAVSGVNWAAIIESGLQAKEPA